jgi:signal transduction histidine kinase/CheY-like chemotaxis protein
VEFLAVPADTLVGGRILDFISGSSPELIDEVWANASRQRHTLIEAYCVRGDGSMFPSEIAVNRVDLGEGRELCFSIRDVTLRKQAEEAREQAMARLEEHDRVRTQFVSNVSHELRTPLTSMIYAVANLLRGVAGPLTGRVREYIEMLDGDCRRLLATITDILDLRRIDTQSLSLSRTRVPLAPLVMHAMEALRVQARQKGQTLELDPGPRWWFVDCDVAKMERVIVNIVGNAVKFTGEHGGVRLVIEPDPERAGFVRLCVEDSGVGIPRDEIDRVTQRYYTVGKQPAGSGLGLAIAKEIVDIHGGHLTIESPVPRLGRGTGVKLSLPLVESARILIVSGDAVLRERLTDEFAAHGYRVEATDDYSTPPARFESGGIDAVLLDFCSADAEARELLLGMKTRKTSLRIPVVALTPPDLSGQAAAVLRSFSIPSLPSRCAMHDVMDLVSGAFLDRLRLAQTTVLQVERPRRDPSG